MSRQLQKVQEQILEAENEKREKVGKMQQGTEKLDQHRVETIITTL